jgi:hypothetical protein
MGWGDGKWIRRQMEEKSGADINLDGRQDLFDRVACWVKQKVGGVSPSGKSDTTGCPGLGYGAQGLRPLMGIRGQMFVGL